MTGQQPLLPLDIGERLRLLREQRELKLSDVARKIRVPEEVLARVEEGETDGIAPVYLKGYLRAYADFIDLSPADLEGTLRAIDESEPTVRSVFREPPRRSPVDRWLRVTSYVLATLLVGTLAWQFTHEAVRLSGIRDRVEVLAEPPDSTATSTASLELLQQPRRPAGNEAWAALREADAPETSSRAGLPQGHRLISLSASADTWVEIRDSQGRLVVMDLLRAGGPYEYHGTAPFDILLGRASAVELALDGTPVELPLEAADEVTRFSLGVHASPDSPSAD